MEALDRQQSHFRQSCDNLHKPIISQIKTQNPAKKYHKIALFQALIAIDRLKSIIDIKL